MSKASKSEFNFTIVVNCGPCEQYIEKCISSIRDQDCVNWTAVVTADPCGDNTYERALAAAAGESRIDVRQNNRQCFAMENLVRGIERSRAAKNDVIVVLDGDDWFASPGALRTIHRVYRSTGCWMTYGSWLSNNPEMPGLWPAYPEGTENFRQIRWLATALRTWKRWLWDLVDRDDFRDEEGRYFRVGEDMAAMFPMLEMSGTDRARHIPEPLMLYNHSNPAGAAKIWREDLRRTARLIRSRPYYERLCAPVVAPAA
ncbi:MAG: glycosyltransferase family 2 protein [Pseudomonadota bacterium]